NIAGRGSLGTLVEMPRTTLDLALTERVMEGGLVLETPVPSSSVRGVVRDEHGDPVPGATVGWGHPDQGFTATTNSDEHGAFELDHVPPGAIFLRAGNAELGLARLAPTLASGEELAWNAVLERRDEVAGRVALANGDALDGARVELWGVGVG